MNNNQPDWPDLPDLQNFWFMKGGYITRDKLNTIVGRDIDTGRYKYPDELQVFLGGHNDIDRKGLEQSLIDAIKKRGVCDSCSESKKIFSFRLST
jgi:hypothetical protein